jgi:hypothetical protein
MIKWKYKKQNQAHQKSSLIMLQQGHSNMCLKIFDHPNLTSKKSFSVNLALSSRK